MRDGSSGRLSASDWRLMRALWAATSERGQATAREVLEALEPGTEWAYTTVKTLLDRLVEKQVVKRARGEGVWHYRPRITREEAQRREVEALKQGVFGGRAAPLVHLLLEEERLGKRDREELRRLLRRAGVELEEEES